MNCFMGYNPLVAKEVKITTWIKEFDGESPVYPSFPNDGDCFVVFATDEDALTHNALSKKTYTNGDWADAESGGGGGGSSDFSTCMVTLVNTAVTLKVYSVVPQPGYCIISDGELLTSTISDSADSSIELEFMTYKGQSVVNVYSAVDLTVSGNATAEYYDDDPDDTYYEVTIAGDCTITAEGTDAVA